MEFYPKDKDPRLDDRGARFRARVLKEDLATLPYVPNTPNRDINIQRASNYVSWDYGKDMWASVDHLMISLYIKAKTTDDRDFLEDKLCRDVVKLIKGPRYYEQAKVYCMIDIDYPEDQSIYDIVKKPKKEKQWSIEGDEGDVTYNVTLHVQECNNTDLAVYNEESRGDFFNLSGQNLEEKQKEPA